MARKIGEHREGGVDVRWFDHGDGSVTVEHSHDAQDAVDIAAGGAPTIDGLGKPVAEIDQVVLMAWAQRRGIPWDKLMYSPEYDGEFRRFIAEHKRLQYANAKTVHTLQ